MRHTSNFLLDVFLRKDRKSFIIKGVTFDDFNTFRLSLQKRTEHYTIILIRRDRQYASYYTNYTGRISGNS